MSEMGCLKSTTRNASNTFLKLLLASSSGRKCYEVSKAVHVIAVTWSHCGFLVGGGFARTRACRDKPHHTVVRVLQRVAAAQAGMSMEDAERALEDLAVLLPGIESRLTAMKPEILAGFLSDTAGLAVALITLKGFFPEGNPAQMVVRRPSLALGEDLASVGEAARRLRELLPDVDVDRCIPLCCLLFYVLFYFIF
jgi:hypothetical protein